MDYVQILKQKKNELGTQVAQMMNEMSFIDNLLSKYEPSKSKNLSKCLRCHNIADPKSQFCYECSLYIAGRCLSKDNEDDLPF